jgi:adenylyltransferase/sulfurtransferase
MEELDYDKHLAELKAMIQEAIGYALKEAELEAQPVKSISSDEFVELARSGGLGRMTVIDVREKDEHEADNIGGINIPLGQVEGRVGEIPKDVKVLIHCKSGRRSEDAVRRLQVKFGFDNLYNLTGGLNAVRGITDCGCLNDRVKEAMAS